MNSLGEAFMEAEGVKNRLPFRDLKVVTVFSTICRIHVVP